MSRDYSLCALIPVFNHGSTVGRVVDELSSFGIEIVLVDDGSEPSTAKVLDELDRTRSDCRLVRLQDNSGKGGAVMAGLKKAFELGYSHALQVDADGQHDLTGTKMFLEESAKRPEALVAGCPMYDESAPASRMAGRKITNFWVAVETLSREIPDAMCGFRVYPIARTLASLRALSVNQRMGFDIEVLVRLQWSGVPMKFFEVKVDYPEGGISNFRMIRDNLGITGVHVKLFFGMVFRLPVLIVRRLTTSIAARNRGG